MVGKGFSRQEIKVNIIYLIRHYFEI